MKKVLITGGAGYIGSQLTEELLKLGHEVLVYDNLMYKQTSLLHLFKYKNFQFKQIDVTHTDDLLKTTAEFAPTVIIPLAALVGMPACRKNESLAWEVNYQHVVDLIKHFNSCKIILPNTNSQYGTSTDIVTEDSPTNPLSLYSKTKCDAEEYMLRESDGISLRLATVFGSSPRMRLDLLVNDFVYRAKRDKFLVLFESNFVRNYIHVMDVVKAFILMIDKYDELKGNVYNVGLSTANLTKLQLAEKIKEYVPDLVIKVDDFAQDADKRNYIVSNAKLEATGWSPDYSIDRGIVELLQSFDVFDTVLNRNFTNL